jgi:hypothetical protein
MNERIPSPASARPSMTPAAEELASFAASLVPLSAICRPGLSREQVLAYHALLADLPREALYAAAIEIASSRVYPTWPMPGEIRQAALAMLEGGQLTAIEAWSLALSAARRMVPAELTYVVRGGERCTSAEWNERILAKLPASVAFALTRFGWQALKENETCRAQFRDAWTQLTQRERRVKALPPAVQEFAKRLEAQAVAALEGNS